MISSAGAGAAGQNQERWRCCDSGSGRTIPASVYFSLGRHSIDDVFGAQTATTTHLVCSSAEFAKRSNKVLLAEARGEVSLDHLEMDMEI
jgi:hypothetical protein